jgi:hypothetical protein
MRETEDLQRNKLFGDNGIEKPWLILAWKSDI